jgi:hypothetical protein
MANNCHQNHKALTKKEGPEICWDGDKMVVFISFLKLYGNTRLPFCQHPYKCSVLLFLVVHLIVEYKALDVRFTYFPFFRLGTPLCMDQFGWSEEETVLYFGILIASASVLCVFLFAIGKISVSNFLFHWRVYFFQLAHCAQYLIFAYFFYSWPIVQEIRRKEGVDLRGNPFHVLRTYYSLSHTGI